MATKKKAAKEEAKDVKKKAVAKTDEQKKAERKAKAEARKARLASLPEGQRGNSKQFDVIETANGKVMNFAYPVRKFGLVITSVAVDENGNVISTSVYTLPGASVKSKKGHGMIVMKTPGVGKKSKEVEEDEDYEEPEVEVEDIDEEDED